MAFHSNILIIPGDIRPEIRGFFHNLGLINGRPGRVVDYTEAANLGPEGAAVAQVEGLDGLGYTVVFDASLLFAAVGPSPWTDRLDAIVERRLKTYSSNGKRALHAVLEHVALTYGVSVYEDGAHRRAWLSSEDEVVCDVGDPIEDLKTVDPRARILDLIETEFTPWERVQLASFTIWTYDLHEEESWTQGHLFQSLDEEWNGADAEEVDQVEEALRWRLILGQFSDERLGFDRLDGWGESEGPGGESSGSGSDLNALLREAERMDTTLEYIYDREFARRSHRSGGGESSGLSVPAWLDGVRDLFPQDAVQVIERDALTRYGMTELVTDPEILRNATPSEDLLKAIISFKHMMNGEVLDEARKIVAAVVDQMKARILSDCAPALYGSADPDGRPPMRTFRNVDWRKTILRNLKNYDRENERLIADRFFYKHRQKKRSNWRIIISVDQSGSMMDSLIHSSIMAAIFWTLPSVEVHLVLWDTRIVDATPMADDPLEVLMKCQLGGGTDMLPAMRYCSSLITEPERTIFVLISDWYIWGERKACLSLAHELHEAGVTGIGLCALDADARPIYDEGFARELANTGWFVAAFTPKKLAEHVSKIIR